MDIKGFLLGIMPLNSCWSSQDDNDIGNLWIGTRTVREKTEELKKLSPEIIISLLHHPDSYFAESERAHDWLIHNCHMIMLGHLHRSDVKTVSAISGQSVIINAGAAYQGSNKPCRVWFITLNTEKQTVKLKPMKYVDGPQFDTWVLDTGVFPEPHIKEVQLPSFLQSSLLQHQSITQPVTTPATNPVVQTRSVGKLPNKNDVLNLLNRLLPAQLETVIFTYDMPTAYISQNATPAEKAISLIRYAGQSNELTKLLDVIYEVAPHFRR